METLKVFPFTFGTSDCDGDGREDADGYRVEQYEVDAVVEDLAIHEEGDDSCGEGSE